MYEMHSFLDDLYNRKLATIVTVIVGEKTSSKVLFVVSYLFGNKDSNVDWVLFRDTREDTDKSVYRKFWVKDIEGSFYEKMTGCYYISFKNGVLPAEIN